MLDLATIKITQRDEQVLKLLVQGCSNKEIAAQLKISPRTVKQHLRTLFLRAGIRDGRKRVKLTAAPRSTQNQAFIEGHLRPSAALLARIEHDSEHKFPIPCTHNVTKIRSTKREKARAWSRMTGFQTRRLRSSVRSLAGRSCAGRNSRVLPRA